MEGKLLVVEDDPQVRKMLVRNLSYEGFDVNAVEDVAGAHSALSGDRPDLILLDLMLPDGDGTVSAICANCGHDHGAMTVEKAQALFKRLVETE